MTYPQDVHNSGEKKCFAGKSCGFPRFYQQKYRFSVDNPVHSVYKPVQNAKS